MWVAHFWISSKSCNQSLPYGYGMFSQLSNKYGKVYCLYMGSKLVVMVNDYEAARQAFRNPNISDRPVLKGFPHIHLGILFSSGKVWQFQRRFTSHQFRQHGIGKSTFQDKIAEETSFLIQEFQHHDGQPMDPNKYITNAVSNVLCSVIFGKRFNYSDDDFHRVTQLLNKQFELAGNGAIMMFVPILSYLLPKRLIKQTHKQVRSFTDKIVAEHREKFINSELLDYTDVFLTELGNNNNIPDYHGYDNDTALHQTIIHLFAAGTETTSTSLRWCLLLMTAHPQIQRHIQREIDSVVGRNRLPRLDDHLPFTEATIMEVQRYATIVPLGVPHEVAEETSLLGYTIPKGAIILSNIWAIHHDPEIWTNPDEFRPERFLDGEGNICQPKEYMPFSVGHRKCLGENLAKMELFIVFSSLLHQFTFKTPPGVKVSLEGILGATFKPKAFEILAINRD